MRLLVLADNASTWPRGVGGRWDLRSLVESARPDALISLGDYSSVHAKAILRAGAHHAFGVYGNHCTQVWMPTAGVIDLIGDRTLPARRGILRVPGVPAVSVLAVQGCVRYKQDADDVLFTQEEYANVLDHVSGADLVITHAPPRGVNDMDDDAHVGIDALRDWVDRENPRWLLHGHVYDKEPVITHRGTRVFFVHGHSVIDLPLQ